METSSHTAFKPWLAHVNHSLLVILDNGSEILERLPLCQRLSSRLSTLPREASLVKPPVTFCIF